jgi:hypothetical protein
MSDELYKQIIPATGWRCAFVSIDPTDEGERINVEIKPLLGFALMADGADVVPLIFEDGTQTPDTFRASDELYELLGPGEEFTDELKEQMSSRARRKSKAVPL